MVQSPVAERSPYDAWRELVEGNARFVAEATDHPHQGMASVTGLTTEQHPFATIFGCSDSRVPAEIVFDQGLGDLFVVRTAGHVIGQSVLGSLEYSVEVLQVPLIVVVSHTGCGAIASAVHAMRTGDLPTGFVRDLIERISPSMMVTRPGGVTYTEDVATAHLVDTVGRINERSSQIRHGIEQGRLAIVGVRYDLATAAVTRVTSMGDLD